MSQDLTKLHTKQLLAQLHNLRAGYSQYIYVDSLSMTAEEASGTQLRINAIKAELAKRPHIPNKAEAKRIRQEKAKRK